MCGRFSCEKEVQNEEAGITMVRRVAAYLLAGLPLRSGRVHFGSLLLVACGGHPVEETALKIEMPGVRCEMPNARGTRHGRVGDVVGLRGGRVAIAERDRMVVVVLSREGVEVGTFGRLGAGPGEFLALTRVWSDEWDTVVVWDARARRLSVMHPDVGFIRARSLGTSNNSLALLPMARFSSGHFLWGEFGGKDITAKRRVSRSPIWLYTGTPDAIIPLGLSVAGPEVLRGGRRPTVGVGFGHTSLLTIVGDTIVVHDNATAVISRYNDKGELLNRLPVPGPRKPRAVGLRDANRMREERVARTRRVMERAPQAGSLIRSYLHDLRDAPVARYMPLSDGLLSDSRGQLWVGEYVPAYDLSTHSRRWWVLDSDGANLHNFRLPALANIEAVSEEGFWVVAEDAEDGSTVVERLCFGPGGKSCGPCRTEYFDPG